jgi:group I intron endonuclease
MKKYGKDIFITRVVDWADSAEQLNKKEKAYIAAYRILYGKECIYNIADGGDGGPITLGMKHSEEHKRKISWLGKHHTEETKIKMSRERKGVKKSPEAIEKNRIGHLGKKTGPHSEETKAKIREAALKRPPMPEWVKVKLRGPRGSMPEEVKAKHRVKRGSYTPHKFDCKCICCVRHRNKNVV